VGWFALALQLYLILVQSPARGVAMVGTVITYFSFFTILTNILVALVLTAVALGLGAGWAATGCESVAAGRHRGLYHGGRAGLPTVAAQAVESARRAMACRRAAGTASWPLGYMVYWLFLAPRRGCGGRRMGLVGLSRGVPGVHLVRGAVSGV